MGTYVQEEYAKALRGYLEKNAHDAVTAFLVSHKFDEVYSCITTYFDVVRSSNYAETDKRVLTAFYDLMSQTLKKGDKYVALRFEALAVLSDTPWHQRYGAL